MEKDFGWPLIKLINFNVDEVMRKTIAIIPARGGSKGIYKKNLVDVGGRKLVTWSIEQALNAKNISSVWVTSDDEEILEISKSSGARIIKRPPELSDDIASSESAWQHAIEFVRALESFTDVIGLQATSPIRDSFDLDSGISKFYSGGYDSLISVNLIKDYFVWKKLDTEEELIVPVNYDHRVRKIRQDITEQYLENGSFYIFKADTIKEYGSRIGPKCGYYVMESHKRFQIDEVEDIKLCNAIFQEFYRARGN
jgi:N-acylneuraminate cytidylyltransferase